MRIAIHFSWINFPLTGGLYMMLSCMPGIDNLIHVDYFFDRYRQGHPGENIVLASFSSTVPVTQTSPNLLNQLVELPTVGRRSEIPKDLKVSAREFLCVSRTIQSPNIKRISNPASTHLIKWTCRHSLWSTASMGDSAVKASNLSKVDGFAESVGGQHHDVPFAESNPVGPDDTTSATTTKSSFSVCCKVATVVAVGVVLLCSILGVLIAKNNEKGKLRWFK